MVHDLELQLATVEASAALEAAGALGQVQALQDKIKELELERDADREQLKRYDRERARVRERRREGGREGGRKGGRNRSTELC